MSGGSNKEKEKKPYVAPEHAWHKLIGAFVLNYALTYSSDYNSTFDLINPFGPLSSFVQIHWRVLYVFVLIKHPEYIFAECFFCLTYLWWCAILIPALFVEEQFSGFTQFIPHFMIFATMVLEIKFSHEITPPPEKEYPEEFKEDGKDLELSEMYKILFNEVALTNPKKFTALLLSAVFSYAGGSIKPYMIGQALDEGFDNQDQLKWWINKFIIFGLIEVVGFTCQGILRHLLINRVSKMWKVKIFETILQQEMGYFDTQSSGLHVAKIRDGVIKEFVEVSRQFFELFTQIILVFYISFTMQPRLAIVALSTCPVLMWWVSFSTRVGGQLDIDADVIRKKKSAIQVEVITNIRVVRLFASVANEVAKYTNLSKEEITLGASQAVWHAMGWFNHGYCENISAILTIWYGFKMVGNGEATMGELMMFLTYAKLLGHRASWLVRLIEQAAKVKQTYQNTFKLLRRTTKLPLEDHQKPETFDGNICLKDVKFAYPKLPDKMVIKNCCLEIPAGKTCAFVGESGCGKSTIIWLLNYFYGQQSGSITIDGIPISDYDSVYLAQHQTCVPQEGALFGRSIRENITYGMTKKVSDEEIKEACKMANAWEFIVDLKDEKGHEGLDAEIGERGVTLSGGQRQRVCIARALVRKPKILLLDEATSALDSISEKEVQNAIETLMQHRDNKMTVVMVAHRLSTVQNCDIIFVMKDGVVIEQGDHASLLKQNGIYAELVETQSLAPAGEEGKFNFSNLFKGENQKEKLIEFGNMLFPETDVDFKERSSDDNELALKRMQPKQMKRTKTF